MKYKYCPECGTKTKEIAKFCEECGYNLIITDIIEDKGGHIRKVEEIIESESPIEVPKKLTLMPGEKLLERHMYFYVSDKRLIKHVPSLFGAKTEDYHYRHIKGIREDNRRPFLAGGLVIGIISLLIGGLARQTMFYIIGAIIIVLAFWFKKLDLVVMHMDGGLIRVPNIKSESGKKVANILRTQLYNK